MFPKEYTDFRYDTKTASRIHKLVEIICEEEKSNNSYEEDDIHNYEEYGIATELVFAQDSDGFKCFNREELITIFKHEYLGCWGYHMIDKLKDNFFSNIIDKYLEFQEIL